MAVHLPLAIDSSAPRTGAVHPVLAAARLGDAPVRVELQGVAFALWRDAQKRPCAVLDRCPHRFAPLSAGRVRPDGRLACGYHGWHFDADGRGQSPSQPTLTGCEVRAVRVSESHGTLWIADHDAPDPRPPSLDTDGMVCIDTSDDATLAPREAVLDRLDALDALRGLRALFGVRAGDIEALDYTLTDAPDALTEHLRAATRADRLRALVGASDMLHVTVTTRPSRVTIALSARRPLARVELFVVPETALRTGVHALLFAPPEHARALRVALRAARAVATDRQLVPTPASMPGPLTSPYAEAFSRARDRRRALLAERAPRPLASPREVPKPVAPWEGFVPFVVARRVAETPDIDSFYLRPQDPRALPAYLPGQHLTLRTSAPETGRPVMRNYSLSDAYTGAGEYRISVKKIRATNPDGTLKHGLFSGLLHERFPEGAVLDVRAPKGPFHLDPTETTPVTLLAGGVGLTPLHAMLRAVANAGGARPVTLLHAVRTRADVLFERELREIVARHPNVRVRWFFSDEAIDEDDAHRRGFITADAVRAVNGSLDGAFFLCGPAPMMLAVSDALLDAGVAAERIVFEGFGPVTLPRLPRRAAPSLAPPQGVTVTFQRAGRSARWTPGSGSLLDLARAQGVDIDSGCCIGSCSTCATPLISGRVRYATPPGERPPEGTCLVCVAEPETDLTLDA